MAKYQNLVALSPSVYRRWQSYYSSMAEPKASRTAILSQILTEWLDGEGAPLDSMAPEPGQMELF